MASDLYRRTMAFNYGDNERGDLMRKVWEPTPWMVDTYVGRYEDGRERDILDWCYRTFGQQASPIHDRPGTWQRGGATIYGWTWFGFATEAQMNLFTLQWPTPADVKVPA